MGAGEAEPFLELAQGKARTYMERRSERKKKMKRDGTEVAETGRGNSQEQWHTDTLVPPFKEPRQ